VLVNSTRQQQPLETLASGRWYGFAAIGNPLNFQTALQRLGCRLSGFTAFPDHHAFTADDLRRLQQAAQQAGAEQLVCTGKDLVKIAAVALGDLPVWAVQSSLKFVAGEPELSAKIRQTIDSVQVFT
jgi:tetraacyldisaccharide 4'-kinase